MADYLQPGMVLRTNTDRQIRVIDKLGEGGAGSSWLVQLEDREYVLTWYSGLGEKTYEKWETFRVMAEGGSPAESLLWPEAVTDLREEGFGLLLRRIPEGSIHFQDLHREKLSIRQRVDAALHLLLTFRKLHNKGYCFGAHEGEFYILPNGGGILLNAADELTPQGVPLTFPGNPIYVSPEMNRGETGPGRQNDLYAVSVYLFQLLCGIHPLLGKKHLEPIITPETEKALLGTEPLFVFDEEDRTNGPVPGIHAAAVYQWKRLPEYMKQLFRAQFGHQGLMEPEKRPVSLRWIKALLRYRSDLLVCSCGAEWCAGESRTHICEKCGKTYTIPLRIDLGEYSRPAVKGARIYRGQLAGSSVEESVHVVAQVMEKNDAPGVLGLQNRSAGEWMVEDGQGDPRVLAPGKVLPLKAGLLIRMGEQEMRILEAQA